MTRVADAWTPSQYNRFAAQREQPFWDLAGLLEPVDRPTLVDLGCGDGRLTAALHTRLRSASTLGLDSSAAMLADAAAHAGDGVTFAEADIASVTPDPVDIVFANAALQWVPDHPAVLARWTAGLVPGGQLAVQVPANNDHPSHTVSVEVAAESTDLFAAPPPADPVAVNVLAPERYAEVLHDLGYDRQHVRLQVYPHVLDSTADVVEWVRGTSLTRFQRVLGPAEFEEFLRRYRSRLLAVLGDRSPYLYCFKRILFWGRLP
jgi:trans-aconitate 2-methyltransferase